MASYFSTARLAGILSLFFLINLTAAVAANNAVLQRGYTPDVAGANLNETILSPGNVSPSTFGRVFSLPVDGSIYAQPLYVPDLAIGGGIHNVVFVATMKDGLYAFDADQPGPPLWAINYANTIPGSKPVPIVDYVFTNSMNIAGPVGIESTPVIDLNSNTIYFVTNTYEISPAAPPNIMFRLHAVDITNGAEKFGGPVAINGTFTVGGNTLNFDPTVQNQRTSLTLANGQVIVAFASHEDYFKYYGWVMSYDATTLAMTGIFNGAPSNHGAAVWQSGRPPAVDSDGNVYLYTGNGFPDTAQPSADGGPNFAESVLKLDPKTLTVKSYFTPANFQDMDLYDQDFSSSGPSLIPGSHVLIGGGKTGILYLLDTQNLGQKQTNDAGAMQILPTASSGQIHGGPVVWSRSASADGPLIYNWGAGDSLKAFSYTPSSNNPQTGNINATPVLSFSGSPKSPLLYPGGIMALSANGDQNGIIWAAINSQGDAGERVPPGELAALNAADLKELWHSTDVPQRDDLGLWSKYVPPLVANGKVFMATQSNQLVVYGVLPSSGAATVTAWPPRQAALGGVANFVVSALSASGATVPATWTVTGLPVGANGQFVTDAHGRTVLQVVLGATTPQGGYRLNATANDAGQLTTQAVLLDVPDSSAVSVAKVVADSQISPHLAKVAADGNSNTFWQSRAASPYTHRITLDLGSVKPVTAISYLPRQDGCVDGTVLQYEVTLSTDGINGYPPSAGGSFDYGAAWRNYACNSKSFPQVQTISFPPLHARYVWLDVLGSVIDGDSWASAAEVKVYVANGSVPLAGDYLLLNRFTNMVMDAYSQTPAAGVPVTQQVYAAGDASQQWHIAAAPTRGYYSLTNLGSDGLVLDVVGDNNDFGASLDVSAWSGGGNQQFNFTPLAKGIGFYTMTNLNSGQCNWVWDYSLAVGEHIVQWPCNYDSATQHWGLIPANPALP